MKITEEENSVESEIWAFIILGCIFPPMMPFSIIISISIYFWSKNEKKKKANLRNRY